MSDDDLNDFAELARDVAAYASYMRDMGVTHIGGAPKALAAPRPSAVSPEPEPENAMPRKRAGEAPGESATPLLFGAPEADAPSLASAPAPEQRPESDETLEGIRADLGECVRCKLHETRTTIVFGEGAPKAALMFVGEGPGADEDASGRPFVGAAGQLLDKIIGAIGYKREDVYIANVVKCRPPGNRKPERDESQTCQQFLFRQIASIGPRVIVCLGNTPMESLLGVKGGITKIRGEFYDYHGIKVMPTFHPAYLLRDPTKKREVWQDMKKVKAELEG